MPLNDVSLLAISPYIARVNKALEFYVNNNSKIDSAGLMLSIAQGPELGWSRVDDDEVPPLPSLNTKDLTNIIGFKRYNNMKMVVADATGNISVGGLIWKEVTGATLDELKLNCKLAGARWVYVDAELAINEFQDYTYRQVGLYSHLAIDTTIAPGYANTISFLPSQIKTITGLGYDGILEVYENRYPTVRPREMREIFSWVLEF